MFEYVFKFLLKVFSLCYVVKIVTEKRGKKWCGSVCLYFYLFVLLNYKNRKDKKKN
jgi:hypothetical protein